MKIQETKPKDVETAYIEVSPNYVEYSVVINEYVIADLDEDDNLVGLELLSLKEIPTVEEIESYVDVDWVDVDTLESGLWDLGAYTRIQQAFGNGQRNEDFSTEQAVGEGVDMDKDEARGWLRAYLEIAGIDWKELSDDELGEAAFKLHVKSALSASEESMSDESIMDAAETAAD